MPRKTKKELTPEEKKQQLQERVEQCNQEIQTSQESTEKLQAELSQVQHLPTVKDLVLDELEELKMSFLN